MIKVERNEHETHIEASGSIPCIAADACEIIRAIYFELSTNQRELFRACVELAVSHKDSPMWKTPPFGERVSVYAEDGELARQIDTLIRRGGSGEDGVDQ